jgi:hypothetical protein
MNFRKRTKEEVDYAVDVKKDFTGGYEFMPWLLWMRPMYVVGMFGNLAFGIAGWKIGIVEQDPIGFAVGGFFTAASILIFFLLRRDFKEGKQGKTR